MADDATNDLQALASPPANDTDTMASVFGLDDSFDNGFTPPSSTNDVPAAPAPLSAPAEPAAGAGVVAPSPVPVAAPVAPQQAPVAPALPPLATPAPAATPQQPAPAAPAQPAAPTAQELEMASLRATIAHLQAQITQSGGQPGTPPTSPAQPAAPEAPRYELSIPSQLGDAIFSEDRGTAIMGMQHMINSLASTIHQRLQGEFRQELNSYDQRQVQAQTATQQQQQAQQAQQAYYSAFPTHNNPVVQQIVFHEAQQLQAQYPNLPFDQNYISALGARVNASIALLNGQQQQQPPAPAPALPPTHVPPRPAPFAPTGQRMAPVTGDDLQDMMDQTMAGGMGPH